MSSQVRKGRIFRGLKKTEAAKAKEITRSPSVVPAQRQTFATMLRSLESSSTSQEPAGCFLKKRESFLSMGAGSFGGDIRGISAKPTLPAEATT
jgi:hypothetical protein